MYFPESVTFFLNSNFLRGRVAESFWFLQDLKFDKFDFTDAGSITERIIIGWPLANGHMMYLISTDVK